MKNVKAVTILFLLLFVCAGVAYPEEKGAAPRGNPPVDISVRSNKHDGFVRIVFEGADEQFFRNASVTQAKGQIIINFPSTPNLAASGTLEIEVLLKGKTYVIKASDPFTMKVLRLSAPPRLSIDIISSPKEEGGRPVPPGVAPRKEEVRKSPAEGRPPEAVPSVRVVLDAGHGGYDFGIVSGDVREKDVTLAVARDIDAAFTKRNRPAFLTRKADQFLSITDRAASIGQRPFDVFLSIHLSLSETFVLYTFPAEPSGADSSGAEFYNITSRQRRFAEKSKALAEGIGKALKAEFGDEILYREMNLPLLGSVGAPAVLIEIPATMTYDKATRARLADAMVKGVFANGNR
jgi:N-acetylmuramoyl-L-alanine amidase